MRSRRIFGILLVILLTVHVLPADALDMKNTQGRPTPNLADEWDSRWAAATAGKIARYHQDRAEQPSMVTFLLAVFPVLGILVCLAAKFRIWAMHSTLVNLNTLGNGWLLWWAARWGAF